MIISYSASYGISRHIVQYMVQGIVQYCDSEARTCAAANRNACVGFFHRMPRQQLGTALFATLCTTSCAYTYDTVHGIVHDTMHYAVYSVMH